MEKSGRKRHLDCVEAHSLHTLKAVLPVCWVYAVIVNAAATNSQNVRSIKRPDLGVTKTYFKHLSE